MCGECNRWQHLICGTGISQSFYWKVVRCLGVFEWSCSACSTSTQSEGRETSQISPQPKRRCSRLDGDGPVSTTTAPSCPAAPEVVLPDPIIPESELPAHEPVVPDPVCPEPVLQDPVLAESTAEPTSGHQPTPSFHPEPVHLVPSSPEADLDSESDCESFLECISPAEKQLPAKPVTYSILETGSQHGKRLLISNDGHGFGVRYNQVNITRWDCNMRSCKAVVIQGGNTFKLKQHKHNHRPNPNLKLKLDMITEAKFRAVDIIGQSAEFIAEEICSKVPKEAVNVAKISDLVMIVKRTRHGLGRYMIRKNGHL